MQELRLVGVHQNGRHLLLAAADGTRYRVALDEDLRVAARSRRAGDKAPTRAATAREVQAMLRTGLAVEDVADRTGWTVSKVTVFAAPVLAERAYVAQRAGAVEVDGAEPLSLRVQRRLAGRGVGSADLDWDSGRDEAGIWHVHVSFVAGGRERRAGWRFDPATEHVQPADDEARWLSEPEQPAARVQPHRFGGEQVFDVEKTGGLVADGEEQIALVAAHEPPAPKSEQTDALMTAIREHTHAGDRGGVRRRRRRADAPEATPGNAEATGTSPGVSNTSSTGQPVAPQPDVEPPADDVGAPAELPEAAPVRLQGADELPFAEFGDAPADDRIPPAARGPHPGDAEVPDAPPDAGRTDGPQGVGRRKGRVGVPTWNDVMFGPSRGGEQP